MSRRRCIAFCLFWAALVGAPRLFAMAPPGAAVPPESCTDTSLSAADEAASGGATTVFDRSHRAFGRAAMNLRPELWKELRRGKALFLQRWQPPGSALQGEGLGPLFNARSCDSCHFRDGREAPPGTREALLLRWGVEARSGELRPEPVYGRQLQEQAVPEALAEGALNVRYREVPGRYPDGVPYSLRWPVYEIRDLAYGRLSENLRLSPRMPLAIFGLGLLEAVPEEVILAQADPDDGDGDGVSGRPARTWDEETGRWRLGRFGWKASQASLEGQIAEALAEDLGVTSPIFPRARCGSHVRGCVTGGGEIEAPAEPEISGRQLELLVSYTRLLAVPGRRDAQRADVRRGRELFHSVGCATCHRPRLDTGEVADWPELAGQKLYPYTDLLLHDMGAALEDRRLDPFDEDLEAIGAGLSAGISGSGPAGSREWRTPPLWGLGLLHTVQARVRLLHDGRARSAEEAILWHGGEGARARRAFEELQGSQRRDLLRFLASL